MKNEDIAKMIDGLNAVIQEQSFEIMLQKTTIERLQKELAAAEAAIAKAEGGDNE